MRKRVARVIREQQGCFFDDIARMVIAEMREPTEAMLEAGAHHVHPGYVWQAMVDAILKEPHE